MAGGSIATTTLRALIVDDEKLARDELQFLLKSIPKIKVIATASDGLEAVTLAEKHTPDLVFLDVQMPGLDGLGVVQELAEKGPPLPHFIFATAYDHYAVEAFEVNAIDYLVKPIEKNRLEISIERARKLFKSSPNNGRIEKLLAQVKEKEIHPTKLLVKKEKRLFLIDANDVVYATTEAGLIRVFSTHIEGTSNYNSIEELRIHLDPNQFWRVHRSYLVNINRIKEVIPWFKSSYQLRMNDKRETEIPVSRLQTKRLRELFNL